MYQGGATHSGYVFGSQNPTSFSLKWQRTLNSSFTLDAPVTGGGKVYVNEIGYFNSPSLYGLDASTGATVWTNTYPSNHSISPASFDQGKLYFQSMKGTSGVGTYFYSIDAATGNLGYKTSFNAQWERFFSPTIVNGKSYVNGGTYGGMMSFNNTTGSTLWGNYTIPQYDQWTPTVVGNVGYSYLGSYIPGLYAVDLTTGANLYRIDDATFNWSGWSMYQVVVPDGVNGMFATNGGRLVHFNLGTQAIDYQISDNISGQVSVANGVAYALRNNGVSAFRVSDGQLLWSWVPGGTESLMTNIVVSDSNLYVGSDTTTYAVNLSTHQSEFSYALSGKYALTEDTLYISGTGGRFAAISTVPEPGTLVAIGIGLVCFSRCRRRRFCSPSKG